MNKIKLLRYSIFNQYPHVIQGTSNRTGGMSPAPWDSCNVSYGVGDHPENVRRNREILKKHLALPILVSSRQVHSDKIFVLDDRIDKDLEVEGYDALITNQRGTGLMIQQADCQAVLLLDPVNNIIAAVHSGWRGSVSNIIDKTVAAMHKTFKTNPADIIAAVSPSLGPCCAEFIHYRQELPDTFHDCQVRPNYFDFRAISRRQLTAAGVDKYRISLPTACTLCSPEYFSYRRDKTTGRFATVIGLR